MLLRFKVNTSQMSETVTAEITVSRKITLALQIVKDPSKVPLGKGNYCGEECSEEHTIQKNLFPLSLCSYLISVLTFRLKKRESHVVNAQMVLQNKPLPELSLGQSSGAQHVPIYQTCTRQALGQGSSYTGHSVGSRAHSAQNLLRTLRKSLIFISNTNYCQI